MWRLFLSFLLFAIGPTAQAGTILELDQDFFENSGRIEDAPAGEYGCTTVSGRSEKSEAQRLGLRMQRYCAGEVSVLFIRDRNRFESFKLQSQREGYYQVCCRKKGVKEGRRRTRSQAD